MQRDETQKELYRIVVPTVCKDPESDVIKDGILDLNGKVSGRGAYLCHNPECLKRVKKSRAFERSLNCNISDEIWDRLEQGDDSCE